MIKNYFLSLIRYFNRNKFYSLINLLGLAIGIAASILILLFVFDELSYDTHHEKANRIYRLEANFKIKDKHDNFAITQFPLGPTLKDEYPEVVETARIFPSPVVFFRIDNREIEQDSLYIADSTYFSLFDHTFISGSPATALNRPNTIVLSQSLAHKLFGNENPMGKTIPSLKATSTR
ncbi:MAG: ABC transporter permease [Mariniphaga sp.]